MLFYIQNGNEAVHSCWKRRSALLAQESLCYRSQGQEYTTSQEMILPCWQKNRARFECSSTYKMAIYRYADLGKVIVHPRPTGALVTSHNAACEPFSEK